MIREMPTKEEAKEIIYQDLVTVAFIFETSFGIPLEVFNDWIKECTFLELTVMCVNCRKQYPKFFKKLKKVY